MHIEILLFPGFDELDAIAPYEVLAGAGEATGRLTARYVALGPGPVRAGHGTVIAGVGTLSEAAEILLVPGGGWSGRREAGVRAEVERGAIPSAIAAAHRRGATIASVCTGAMLVAASGILGGRPAVTHRSALADLRASGAEVIEDARVVDDGDILSAGGVTSGIDLALWLLERELGPRLAGAVARELEHTPAGRVWRSGEWLEPSAPALR
jgi:transcriptional regulator GlxA family with amidase domain